MMTINRHARMTRFLSGLLCTISIILIVSATGEKQDKGDSWEWSGTMPVKKGMWDTKTATMDNNFGPIAVRLTTKIYAINATKANGTVVNDAPFQIEHQHVVYHQESKNSKAGFAGDTREIDARPSTFTTVTFVDNWGPCKDAIMREFTDEDKEDIYLLGSSYLPNATLDVSFNMTAELIDARIKNDEVKMVPTSSVDFFAYRAEYMRYKVSFVISGNGNTSIGSSFYRMLIGCKEFGEQHVIELQPLSSNNFSFTLPESIEPTIYFTLLSQHIAASSSPIPAATPTFKFSISVEEVKNEPEGPEKWKVALLCIALSLGLACVIIVTLSLISLSHRAIVKKDLRLPRVASSDGYERLNTYDRIN